jgi:hypothetical protein
MQHATCNITTCHATYNLHAHDGLQLAHLMQHATCNITTCHATYNLHVHDGLQPAQHEWKPKEPLVSA